MRQIRRWLRRIRSTFLQLLEPFYAQELLSREPVGKFTAVLKNGFSIEIHCDRMVFCEAGHYDTQVEHYTVYRVYSKCLGEAPEKLRKACELELQYPVGYRAPPNTRSLFDVMVNHYLNLLNRRLIGT